MARVVVIGAGIVGAACGYFLSRDGHDVTVLDRGPVGGGTTSRGEGNILVSDKAPGPELELARWSAALWHGLGTDPGSGVHADDLELDAKGGLVVATGDEAMAGLTTFAEAQAAAGVDCSPVGGDGLSGYEPHLAPGLPGGASSWSPSHCPGWCGTRCTPPTTWPTSRPGTPAWRRPWWSRAPERGRS
jgi:glycine/D-amino acid oxidase-like deaminating enzyme